jgi:hypothetical protein
MQTKAHIFKNRLGPPQRVCDYEVFFASGIDDYSSWLGVMKDYGLITQSGAWYTYVNKLTGEELKFQSKQFKTMLTEDQQLHDSIYDEICNKLIMKYQSSSLLELENVGIEVGDDSEDYIEESE